MEEKKYINIDNMATRLCQILKDARESMVDDKNKDFIMENFSDEYLEDYSNVMAWQFNSDMKKNRLRGDGFLLHIKAPQQKMDVTRSK